MTTSNQKLTAKIQQNKEKIAKLMNENLDIAYELELSYAEKFTVTEENQGTKRKPNTVKVRWMHWKEEFKDESTGESIFIERRKPVEVNESKSFGWQKLSYYKPEDIRL